MENISMFKLRKKAEKSDKVSEQKEKIAVELSIDEIKIIKESFEEEIENRNLEKALNLYRKIKCYNSWKENHCCDIKLKKLMKQRKISMDGVGPGGFANSVWDGEKRNPVDRVASRVTSLKK